MEHINKELDEKEPDDGVSIFTGYMMRYNK